MAPAGRIFSEDRGARHIRAGPMALNKTYTGAVEAALEHYPEDELLSHHEVKAKASVQITNSSMLK